MIKRFLTLSEVRYWLGVIKFEVWDDKTRRGHLWALVFQMAAFLGITGGLITFAFMNLGTQAGLDDKLDPIWQDTHVVVPMQPGPEFNTANWCNDVLVVNVPQRVSLQIELKKGAETITWVESMDADVARMSWTTIDGADMYETVRMTAAAKDCFRKAAGR